jgi:hypothetical protein
MTLNDDFDIFSTAAFRAIVLQELSLLAIHTHPVTHIHTHVHTLSGYDITALFACMARAVKHNCDGISQRHCTTRTSARFCAIKGHYTHIVLTIWGSDKLADIRSPSWRSVACLPSSTSSVPNWADRATWSFRRWIRHPADPLTLEANTPSHLDTGDTCRCVLDWGCRCRTRRRRQKRWIQRLAAASLCQQLCPGATRPAEVVGCQDSVRWRLPGKVTYDYVGYLHM